MIKLPGGRAPLVPSWSGLPLMAVSSQQSLPALKCSQTVAVTIPEGEALSGVQSQALALSSLASSLLDHAKGSIGSQDDTDLEVKTAPTRGGMSIVFEVCSSS